LQSLNPALQPPLVQLPDAQTPVAFGGAHTMPQPPQWFTLLEIEVSQSPAGPAQSAVPLGQDDVTQLPP
jgi:hypothetical protein